METKICRVCKKELVVNEKNFILKKNGYAYPDCRQCEYKKRSLKFKGKGKIELYDDSKPQNFIIWEDNKKVITCYDPYKTVASYYESMPLFSAEARDYYTSLMKVAKY